MLGHPKEPRTRAVGKSGKARCELCVLLVLMSLLTVVSESYLSKNHLQNAAGDGSSSAYLRYLWLYSWRRRIASVDAMHGQEHIGTGVGPVGAASALTGGSPGGSCAGPGGFSRCAQVGGS